MGNPVLDPWAVASRSILVSSLCIPTTMHKKLVDLSQESDFDIYFYQYNTIKKIHLIKMKGKKEQNDHQAIHQPFTNVFSGPRRYGSRSWTEATKGRGPDISQIRDAIFVFDPGSWDQGPRKVTHTDMHIYMCIYIYMCMCMYIYIIIYIYIGTLWNNDQCLTLHSLTTEFSNLFGKVTVTFAMGSRQPSRPSSEGDGLRSLGPDLPVPSWSNEKITPLSKKNIPKFNNEPLMGFAKNII